MLLFKLHNGTIINLEHINSVGISSDHLSLQMSNGNTLTVKNDKKNQISDMDKLLEILEDFYMEDMEDMENDYVHYDPVAEQDIL